MYNYGVYVCVCVRVCTTYKCHLLQFQIQDGHKSHDGFMRDYCDGVAYNSHPLFSMRRDCLELILYYDDVEICNPLGSRRCKHKIGE